MSLYITPGGRIYHAGIGRFLQKDLLARPGTNPYIYANNNPLKYVDPDGRAEITLSGIDTVVNTGVVIQKLKDAIKEAITGGAEISYEVYIEVAAFANEHPWIVDTLNAIIDAAKPQLKRAADLNHETLGWHDLVLIWLLELGDKTTLVFDEKANTTKDLMQQEGVQEARKKAREWQPGQKNPIVHTWRYLPNQFWAGMREGNLCTSFLGSYRVEVEVICDGNTGKRTGKFTVKNTSSWESATRLRKRAKPGEHTQGVIPNRKRNDPGIHLGGTIKEEWHWEEDR